MKLRLVVGVVMGVALAGLPVSADQTIAGVRLGVAVPVAGIAGPLDPVFTLAGWASRPLRGPVSWRAEVGHDRVRLSGLLRSLCAGAGIECDAHVGVTYFAGGVQSGANTAKEVAPFGYVTVGLYRVGAGGAVHDPSGRLSARTISEVEHDFGVSVGGGLRLALTERWGVYAEARYSGFTFSRSDAGWASLITGAVSLALGF